MGPHRPAHHLQPAKPAHVPAPAVMTHRLVPDRPRDHEARACAPERAEAGFPADGHYLMSRCAAPRPPRCVCYTCTTRRHDSFTWTLASLERLAQSAHTPLAALGLFDGLARHERREEQR